MRRALRDLTLGLLLTVVLLVAVEAGCRIAGIGEPGPTTDLSRGFDAEAAYIVPDPDVPGGFVTQFGDEYCPDRTLPPRDRRARVLLFGGSNTNSFMIERLRRNLRLARYDAHNLGRSGYGSERVRLLFDQALDTLSPDVVVIYSGHNEFIEQGFQEDLEERWSGGWQADVAAVARRNSYAFNSLVGQFAKRRVSAQKKPEAWKGDHERYEELTYEETLSYYQAYRDNLRYMCWRARQQGVGVVLCTVVYNRLSAPYSSTHATETSDEDRKRFRAERRQARALYTESMRAFLPPEERDRLDPHDYGRDSMNNADPAMIPGRRPSSGRLATQDPLLPNQEAWTPRLHAFYEATTPFYARTLTDEERADLQQAEVHLERALQIVSDHPRAWFERGLIAYLLAEGEEDMGRALEYFELAGRYDRAPRRANELTNQIVREVAEEDGECVLFDADAMYTADAPEGLMGWEWLLDHCHINVGLRVVLLEDLAETIRTYWPARSILRKRNGEVQASAPRRRRAERAPDSSGDD